MTAGDAIGSVGVALLLIAFFLNSFGVIPTNTRTYQSLNLVGAALACFASYLVRFYPFVVLEGAWTVVSFVALLRVVRGRSDSPIASV